MDAEIMKSFVEISKKTGQSSEISDIYNLEPRQISINEWGNVYCDITMDDFLKTHYSDYFFIIPSRETQITARAILSSNLTASLAKTHQLFKN